MRFFLNAFAAIFIASLAPASVLAQSDPRFAEAIAAEANWDRDAAYALLKPACDENVAGACGRLLSMYIEDNDEANQRTLSSNLCEERDAYACFHFGNMANWGNGGAEDKPLARESYKTACDAHLPIACVSLAQMIRQGEGGAKDAQQALAISRAGCLKKHGPACLAAADMIESSIWTGETRENSEVAQMLSEVRSLYGKACDNSIADACMQLAKMLRQGDGGAKDAVGAMRLMQDTCATHIRACEQVIRLRFYQP